MTIFKLTGNYLSKLPKAVRENRSDSYSLTVATPRGYTGSWLMAQNLRTKKFSRLDISKNDISKYFEKVSHR